MLAVSKYHIVLIDSPQTIFVTANHTYLDLIAKFSFIQDDITHFSQESGKYLAINNMWSKLVS